MSETDISEIALVFSAISLIPLLFSGVRRFLLKIEVFDKGFAIIGFSALGSTISIPMSFKAWNFDAFVPRVHLKITNTTASVTRDCEMMLFRTEKYSVRPGAGSVAQTASESTIESAQPFFLEQSAPRFVDVVFGNSFERNKIASQVERVKKVIAEISAVHAQSAQVEAVPNYIGDPKFIALRENIRKEIFWSEGVYEIVLSVITSRPSRKFSFKYKFSLSAEDARLLEDNDSSIVLEGVTGNSAAYENRYPRIHAVK